MHPTSSAADVVIVESIAGANGFTTNDQDIVIKKRPASADLGRTLVHELGDEKGTQRKRRDKPVWSQE